MRIKRQLASGSSLVAGRSIALMSDSDRNASLRQSVLDASCWNRAADVSIRTPVTSSRTPALMSAHGSLRALPRCATSGLVVSRETTLTTKPAVSAVRDHAGFRRGGAFRVCTIFRGDLEIGSARDQQDEHPSFGAPPPAERGGLPVLAGLPARQRATGYRGVHDRHRLPVACRGRRARRAAEIARGTRAPLHPERFRIPRRALVSRETRPPAAHSEPPFCSFYTPENDGRGLLFHVKQLPGVPTRSSGAPLPRPAAAGTHTMKAMLLPQDRKNSQPLKDVFLPSNGVGLVVEYPYLPACNCAKRWPPLLRSGGHLCIGCVRSARPDD
jgi:hypothetical protein